MKRCRLAVVEDGKEIDVQFSEVPGDLAEVGERVKRKRHVWTVTHVWDSVESIANDDGWISADES